jgi:hypothetical protein
MLIWLTRFQFVTRTSASASLRPASRKASKGAGDCFRHDDPPGRAIAKATRDWPARRRAGDRLRTKTFASSGRSVVADPIVRSDGAHMTKALADDLLSFRVSGAARVADEMRVDCRSGAGRTVLRLSGWATPYPGESGLLRRRTVGRCAKAGPVSHPNPSRRTADVE